jgi:vancomycin permeability regulator SanA
MIKKVTFFTAIKIMAVSFLILVLPFCTFNLMIAFQTLSSSQRGDIKTAMVLGAAVYGNTPSPILRARLDKAAELYYEAKIRTILVSGSNPSTYYNETRTMKSYLVNKKGIPERDIFSDYEGLRTIDSCLRAKQAFSLRKIYLITQDFHLGRSAVLCRWAGLEIVPVPAKDSMPLRSDLIREVIASWQAVRDMTLGYKSTVTNEEKSFEPALD